MRPAPVTGTFAPIHLRGGTLGRIVLLFSGLVIAYDAAASALVRATGWPYALLAVGGLAIQVVAGAVAGRRRGFLWAILAGGVTALAEATLGFGVGWLIGPGRTHLPATLDYLGAVARAVVAGGALGGAGGVVALGWSAGAADGSVGGAARWGVRRALRSLRLDGFLVRRLLVRGLGLWAGLKLLYGLVGGAGGGSLSRFLGADLRLMVLVALVALADLARRREFVLLANLGLGPAPAVALYLVPGALLEGVLLVVLR